MRSLALSEFEPSEKVGIKAGFNGVKFKKYFKEMKKIISVLLIIGFLFLLTGCKTKQQEKAVEEKKPEGFSLGANEGRVIVKSEDTLRIFNLHQMRYEQRDFNGYKFIGTFGKQGSAPLRYLFFTKENEVYFYDDEKGTLTKTSLPALKEDKSTYEVVTEIIPSSSNKEIIFEIKTYKKTYEQSDLEPNSGPSIAKRTVVFVPETNVFQEVNYFDIAKKIIKKNNIEILAWDAENQIVFVVERQETASNGSSVYKILLESKSFSKTKDSEIIVRKSYFTKELEQFFVPRISLGEIHIYETKDLSKPKRKIKIKSVDSCGYDCGLSPDIVEAMWSPSKKQIAFSYSGGIKTIDIPTGETFSRTYNNRQNAIGQSWDASNWSYTSSGDYFVVVNFDNSERAKPVIESLKPENDRYELEIASLGKWEKIIKKLEITSEPIQVLGLLKGE